MNNNMFNSRHYSISSSPRILTFCRGFGVAILILVATLINMVASVQAETFWTAGATSVGDLLTAENWSNGAPVTAGNLGYIDFSGEQSVQTITVTKES